MIKANEERSPIEEVRDAIRRAGQRVRIPEGMADLVPALEEELKDRMVQLVQMPDTGLRFFADTAAWQFEELVKQDAPPLVKMRAYASQLLAERILELRVTSVEQPT